MLSGQTKVQIEPMLPRLIEHDVQPLDAVLRVPNLQRSGLPVELRGIECDRTQRHRQHDLLRAKALQDQRRLHRDRCPELVRLRPQFALIPSGRDEPLDRSRCDDAFLRMREVPQLQEQLARQQHSLGLERVFGVFIGHDDGLQRQRFDERFDRRLRCGFLRDGV